MDADASEHDHDDSGPDPTDAQGSPTRPTERPAGMTMDGAVELLLNQDDDSSEDFFWPAVGR